MARSCSAYDPVKPNGGNASQENALSVISLAADMSLRFFAGRVLELNVCASCVAEARCNAPSFDIRVPPDLNPESVFARSFRLLWKDADRQSFVLGEHVALDLIAPGLRHRVFRSLRSRSGRPRQPVPQSLYLRERLSACACRRSVVNRMTANRALKVRKLRRNRFGLIGEREPVERQRISLVPRYCHRSGPPRSYSQRRNFRIATLAYAQRDHHVAHGGTERRKT